MAAAISCAGLAAARPARAQRFIEVQYDIKQPDPANPKAKTEAPQIEARVIAAPSLAVDKFILVDQSVKPPVQIQATSRRSYSQGSETIAIVMLGWEMWIGNDTYRRKDDSTRTTGMLTPLKAALDKLDLKSAAPPGSLGMLITYADTVRIRVPMGPLGT
jgi:hypothetical protein